MKPSAVLKRARNLLIEKGWCKGQFEQHDGKGKPIAFCTVGALRRVSGSRYAYQNNYFYDARRYLDDSLSKRWKDEGLTTFNDAPERRKDQVIALFDRAIARAQKEGK